MKHRVHSLVIWSFGIFAFYCLTGRAIPTPVSIPRSASQSFRSDGLFEGGGNTRADLKNVRVADHNGDYERWVIDFADPRSGTVGKQAPKFQVRYLPSDRFQVADGKDVVKRPAKFLFLFRGIHKNYLQMDQLKQLVRRSHHVAEIVTYPPIEEGDMAMEFILKDNLQFEAHQPIERPGRLVLDLKHEEPQTITH